MIDFERCYFTADDWGISPGVNDGILELVEKGVVRRVSLMANGKYLSHGLSDLLRFDQLGLGLHFNLTFGTPLNQGVTSTRFLCTGNQDNFGNRSELFWKSLRYQNRREFWEEIRGELRAQIEALRRLSVPLRHFDGHEHIHLVPGLISHTALVFREFSIRETRLPWNEELLFNRKFPVALLSLWQRKAILRHFQVRPFYYPSLSLMKDKTRFEQKLHTMQDFEILVHPARTMDFESLRIEDPYRLERVEEYQSLLALT